MDWYLITSLLAHAGCGPYVVVKKTGIRTSETSCYVNSQIALRNIKISLRLISSLLLRVSGYFGDHNEKSNRCFWGFSTTPLHLIFKKKKENDTEGRRIKGSLRKRMEYPYFGRHQRPRGKQALLVLLLLAVSVWLVYQIKHSINKKAENNGDETKLVEEFAAVSLGRKVTPWLEQTALTHSRNVHVETKTTDSDKEYVFDGTMQDKVEAGFEGKQVEKELEMQSEGLPKNNSKNFPRENSGKGHVKSRKGNESDDKDQGNKNKYPKTPSANDSQSHDKKPEVQIKEPANVVQNREETNSDGSIKENGEEEETKISKEEAKEQQNEDKVHSFQDENGVPSDDNEIELMDGQMLVKEIA